MDTRKEYRELSAGEKEDLILLKAKADEFWEILDYYTKGKAKDIAETRLEEAVMWAVKHITE